jgi:hypothetical protein
MNFCPKILRTRASLVGPLVAVESVEEDGVESLLRWMLVVPNQSRRALPPQSIRPGFCSTSTSRLPPPLSKSGRCGGDKVGINGQRWVITIGENGGDRAFRKPLLPTACYDLNPFARPNHHRREYILTHLLSCGVPSPLRPSALSQIRPWIMHDEGIQSTDQIPNNDVKVTQVHGRFPDIQGLRSDSKES